LKGRRCKITEMNDYDDYSYDMDFGGGIDSSENIHEEIARSLSGEGYSVDDEVYDKNKKMEDKDKLKCKENYSNGNWFLDSISYLIEKFCGG